MSNDKTRVDLIAGKRFDVEHALSLYAYSFIHLPASGLYDLEALKPYEDVIQRCHIYFIGFLPKVVVSDFSRNGRQVIVRLEVLGEVRDLEWEFPQEVELRQADGYWFIETPEGQRFAPTEDHLLTELSRKYAPLDFRVKYIGQSYGADGNRNAISRLMRHETLQKIAVRGAPDGYYVTLLLVEIQPNNRLLTFMNPRAMEQDDAGTRLRSGLNKLFGTDEQERIAIYEAAMIRYFRPEYNIALKDSFPSTRLKLLQDCYEKDFSAVVAEFAFDNLPFFLSSESVPARDWHIASHDLHKEQDRKAFFGF